MIPLHHAPRNWAGETVVLVASGPSTELVDLSLLEGRRVIAVAHGYRAVPRADVLIIGGRQFYRRNRLSDFRGPRIVAAQRYRRWDWLPQRDARLVCMERAGPFGLTDDPTALCGSESSVMLAINYAVHRGASRILLLGCDGAPGPDGRRRVGDLARDTRDAPCRYRAQAVAMASQLEPLAARGIEILNCSPGSRLGVYPTSTLEAAL